MKTAAQSLLNGPQLGSDRFASALNPVASVTTTVRYSASFYDFLTAYAGFKRREEQAVLRVTKPRIFNFEEALERVQKLLNITVPRWESLQAFLPETGQGAGAQHMRRSALASTLLAGLELTKQGKLELRQESAFAPLYLRAVTPK